LAARVRIAQYKGDFQELSPAHQANRALDRVRTDNLATDHALMETLLDFHALRPGVDHRSPPATQAALVG
jgi:hypothetical protein